ncbi:hypothetical protein A2Z00_03500 [Candidatus Gottesmanbacteria bacterium RBG_13_45_10]|uniref:Type II secretion system protein GspG C-terminal domain-containing protein n=1 Tax=Candidatus Gottesmanbacteria bacterium RBG_13_45_10 TaxID=1798370 RepID=A0A1F5ZGL2_9BACT|nr:MAG: hypothetical protein A2Z00_03500 [Candidatus Gottesmanbacteria bacterium RBG_13_45_10]
MARHNKGFTLLELLVSATIIVVLTVIGMVSYSSVNKRSRDVKRKSDLEQIRSALEMYRADNGYYPAPPESTGGFGSVSALSSILVSTYMPAVPTDPTYPKLDYWYTVTNLLSGQYYGYCVCSQLETITAPSSTCTAVSIPAGSCNYGLKSP